MQSQGDHKIISANFSKLISVGKLSQLGPGFSDLYHISSNKWDPLPSLTVHRKESAVVLLPEMRALCFSRLFSV